MMPAVAAIAPIAPIIGGVLGLGASVVGGVMAAKTAKQVASTQSAAADKAQAMVEKQFETTRADLTPFREIGGKATGALSDLYGFGGKGPAFSDAALGGFLSSPEYQTAFKQGIKARDASAAAKGILQSPAQLEAQNRFGADYATNAISGYIGDLMRMAGMGESAAAQTGSFGASAAARSGELGMEGAGSRAAGTLGAYNAYKGMLGDAVTLADRAFGGAYNTTVVEPKFSTFPATSYSLQDTNTMTGVY